MSIADVIKSTTSTTIKNPKPFKGIGVGDACLDENYIYISFSNTVKSVHKENLEVISQASLPTPSIWRCAANNEKLYLVGTKTVVTLSQNLKQLDKKPLYLQIRAYGELFVPYHVTVYNDYLLVAGALFSRNYGEYTAVIGKISTKSLWLEKLYVSKVCTSFHSTAVHPGTNSVWAVGALSKWGLVKLCIEVLDIPTLERKETPDTYVGMGVDATLDSQGNVYVVTHNKLVKLVEYVTDPFEEPSRSERKRIRFDKDLPQDVTPLSIAYANGFIVLLADDKSTHSPRVIVYDEGFEEVGNLSLPPLKRTVLLGWKLLYDGEKVFAVITEDRGTTIYSVSIADRNHFITIVADNDIIRVNGYLYRDKRLSDVIREVVKKEFTEVYVFDGVKLRRVDGGEKVEDILKENVKTIYVL